MEVLNMQDIIAEGVKGAHTNVSPNITQQLRLEMAANKSTVREGKWKSRPTPIHGNKGIFCQIPL